MIDPAIAELGRQLAATRAALERLAAMRVDPWGYRRIAEDALADFPDPSALLADILEREMDAVGDVLHRLKKVHRALRSASDQSKQGGSDAAQG